MSSLPAIASSASALGPGSRLDRYELLCPIAEGGMASVWIARLQGKRGFEKLFAVKTILDKHAKDPHFEQMFLDEARIASAIEHVNVAQILELGEEREVLYLVMEYVDGDALSKLHRALERKAQPFPHTIALRLMSDACAGLHAAHELRDAEGQLLNVVHRDVSPQNILVNSKGVAKIVDFGIAKARDRLASDTNTGALKGKILYMAPEQATGRPMDRRADVWAVGAVLYHLLAGRAPFDADNQMVSLHMLTSRQPPDPLPANVSPAVQAIVSRALAWDPKDRFGTAAEMQAALEVVLMQMGSPTADDVARFVRMQIGDRLEARKKELQVAIAAATERALANGNSTGSFSVPGVTTPSIPSFGGASMQSSSGYASGAPLYSLPGAPPKRAGALVALAMMALTLLAIIAVLFIIRTSNKDSAVSQGGPNTTGTGTALPSPKPIDSSAPAAVPATNAADAGPASTDADSQTAPVVSTSADPHRPTPGRGSIVHQPHRGTPAAPGTGAAGGAAGGSGGVPVAVPVDPAATRK